MYYYDVSWYLSFFELFLWFWWVGLVWGGLVIVFLSFLLRGGCVRSSFLLVFWFCILISGIVLGLAGFLRLLRVWRWLLLFV